MISTIRKMYFLLGAPRSPWIRFSRGQVFERTVQQPEKFEFVALGLTMPPSADAVVNSDHFAALHESAFGP
jgi:hypothetical protein